LRSDTICSGGGGKGVPLMLPREEKFFVVSNKKRGGIPVLEIAKNRGGEK